MGRAKQKAPQVDKVNRSKLKITLELVDTKAVPDSSEGKLGSLSIKLLIDTGASLSIISKGILNQLSGEQNLDPMTRPVMTANDEPLTVYWKTKVSMCIGQNTYQVPVVVAEMNSDGILGLDFIMNSL